VDGFVGEKLAAPDVTDRQEPTAPRFSSWVRGILPVEARRRSVEKELSTSPSFMVTSKPSPFSTTPTTAVEV